MRPQMLIYSFSCHNLSSSQLKGVLQLGRGKEETEREREAQMKKRIACKRQFTELKKPMEIIDRKILISVDL